MSYLRISSVIAIAVAFTSTTFANAQELEGSAVAPSSGARNVGEGDEKLDGLLDMSLEEILSQEVTSVAKKSRRIADSAAAVTVITQEEIRNSSARTVPDLLRMVPGMEVAEIQSSVSSVSARGFTSRLAANLLVMVDGAAIYTTSISGMFWDQALVPLQDIERIEVIRGPGGTLWGSNSVNGIVNIITKQSVDTQDFRANASVGTFDARFEAGYGDRLTENLGYRVYGDYRRHQGLDGPTGPVPGNDWEGGLGGVRLDYAPSDQDSVVFLAEHSRGSFKERFRAVSLDPTMPGFRTEIQDNNFRSSHVLGRWKRQASETFDFTLQAYFNNLFRTEFGAAIDRDLYDVSAEGRWKLDATNEFNFGIAGRIAEDRIGSTFALSHPTGKNTDRWLTGYLQDDITIVPDKLRLTLGSKFEQNNFTGFEIQPSARLFYRPNENLALWGAASRAVKTPLLLNREMRANVTLYRDVPGFPVPVPVNSTFFGSDAARSEKVDSYEMGFRGRIAKGWSFDVAGFYNEYRQLTTGDLTGQDPILVPPYPFPVGLQLTYRVGNSGSAKSKGIEAMLSGTPTTWWKTELSYSYLDLDVKSAPATYVLAGDGSSPNHQIRFQSDMNLMDNLSLNTFVHFVGKSQNKRRDQYTDLDIRLAYRLNSQIELSAVGSNLLDERRLEYYQDTLPLELVYVPRSAYLEARVRF